MTPDQLAAAQLTLASEQTHAAWVAAWASVAQAVGVVAAIYASVKLASDAAKRERAANAAATARAEAAERAAAERIRLAEVAEYNRPLEEAEGIATAALSKLETELVDIRKTYSTHGGTIQGGYNSQWMAKTRDAIDRATAFYREAQVQLGLMEVAEAFQPLAAKSLPGPEYVKAHEELVFRMAGGIERLQMLMRK